MEQVNKASTTNDTELTGVRRADMLEQAVKAAAVELGIVNHDTHLDIFQTIQLVRDISGLNGTESTFITRLNDEYEQTKQRLTGLREFVATEKFESLSDQHRGLLLTQLNFMEPLVDTLKQRLDLLEFEAANPEAVPADLGVQTVDTNPNLELSEKVDTDDEPEFCSECDQIECECEGDDESCPECDLLVDYCECDWEEPDTDFDTQEQDQEIKGEQD